MRVLVCASAHVVAVCPSCMLQTADAIAYVTVPAAFGADSIVLWDSPDAHKPCVGFYFLLCAAARGVADA